VKEVPGARTKIVHDIVKNAVAAEVDGNLVAVTEFHIRPFDNCRIAQRRRNIKEGCLILQGAAVVVVERQSEGRLPALSNVWKSGDPTVRSCGLLT
jgi:hypothetical protein